MHSIMYKRLGENHASLLYAEKFDTWLDLNQLIKLYWMYNQDTWQSIYAKRLTGISWLTAKGLDAIQFSPLELRGCHVSALLITTLWSDALHPTTSYGQGFYTTSSKLDWLLMLTKEITLIQSDHMTSNIHGELRNTIQHSINSRWRSITTFPAELKNLLYLYDDYLHCINEHKLIVQEGNVWARDKTKVHHLVHRHTFRSIPASMMITNNLFFFKYQGLTWLLNNDLFLETFNKIAEMCSTLMHAWFNDGVGVPANYYTRFVSFQRHLSHVMLRRKSWNKPGDLETENCAFIYLKSIEGLGVSVLIEKGDRTMGWVNSLLGPVLWDGLVAAAVVSGAWHTSDLYKLLVGMSEEELTNIIGTVKLHGHPSIEIEKGLEKLYARTHKPIRIKSSTRNECIGVMMRDITKQYYLKNNYYPKFKNLMDIPNKDLSRLIVNNISSFDPNGRAALSRISLQDWYTLKFDQNDIFDKIDNQLSLLKDKSIGKIRPLVVSELTGNIAARTDNRNFTSNKALIAYLLSPYYEESFIQYLHDYQQDEWGPEVLKYLTIKLTAKELEEKPEGRFFGGSSVEERNRRITQEHNVHRLMSKYIPDQLLTPSELEILRKLVYFRTMRYLYDQYYVVNISFDFSAWNNSMRSDSVDVTASHILDEWYDVALFGKTMRAYQHSLVYYKDIGYQRMWDGQEGGIEGLNQATWSMVFIGGVKLALERLGYPYQVTVKGDDVRAAIMVRKSTMESPQQLSMKQQDILNSIKLICNDMGWQLNPNESFVSLSVIATSKQYLYRDTWLPSVDKKIGKVQSHSNMIICTPEEVVSSIFSIAHSSCGQGTVVLPVYMTAAFMASAVLERQFVSELKKHRTSESKMKSTLLMLMMWPQVLSGPGALPLQTFFIRGENDMLSVTLSLYRFLLTGDYDANLKLMVMNVLSQITDSATSQATLLGDSYSLPISSPERPMSLIKKFMRASLSKVTRNVKLRDLLNNTRPTEMRAYMDYILSMRPFFAKVAAVLWECSPFYLVEEILSKFTQSSTILTLLAKGRRHHVMSSTAQYIFRKVVQVSKSRGKYWLDVINGVGIGPYWFLGTSFTDRDQCPTAHARWLREHLWGFDIYGITYPSLVDQSILFDTATFNDFLGHWDRPIGISSKVILKGTGILFQTESQSHHYCVSTRDSVWLGSRTSTSIEFFGDFGEITTPTITKLQKLLVIAAYGNRLGPELKDVTLALIKSYTSIPLDNLLSLLPAVDVGHIAHRMETNSYSQTTMPNTRPNLSQMMRQTSRDLAYPQGSSNLTINYAARHFMAIVLSTFELQFRGNLEKTQDTLYHYVFDYQRGLPIGAPYQLCSHCCADVSDVVVTLDLTKRPPMVDYSRVELVGCGASEELILWHNIRQGVLTKASKLRPNIADRTEKTMLLAAYTVVSSTSAHHRLMSLQMAGDDINPAYVDSTIALNIPTIDHIRRHGKGLSRSLWNDLDPVLIYQVIVSLVYKGIYEQELRYLPTRAPPGVPSAAMIDHVKPLLQIILDASLTWNLVTGCRKSDILVGGLSLSPLSNSNATQLTRDFVSQHWETYSTWFRDPSKVVLPIALIATSIEDLWEDIQQTYQALQIQLSTLLSNLMQTVLNIDWVRYRTRLRTAQRERDPYMSIDLILSENGGEVLPYICVLFASAKMVRPTISHKEQLVDLSFNVPHQLVEISETGRDYMEYWTWIIDTADFNCLDSTYDMVWTLLLGEGSVSSSEKVAIVERMIEILEVDLIEIDEEIVVHSVSESLAYICASSVRRLALMDGLSAKEFLRNPTFILPEPLPQDTPLTHEPPRNMIALPGWRADCNIAVCLHDRLTLMETPHPTTTLQTFSNQLRRLAASIKMRYQSWSSGPRWAVDRTRIVGHVNHTQNKWRGLQPLQSLLDSTLRVTSAIIVVGDDSGGLSSWLLHHNLHVHVIMLTLLPKEKIENNAASDDYNLSVELITVNDPQIVSRFHRVFIMTGDVTKVIEQECILTKVRELQLTVVAVLSDADIGGGRLDHIGSSLTLHKDIVYSVLGLAKSELHTGGLVMIRTGLTDHIEWCQMMGNIMNQYKHIHLVRPPESQVYSNDMYLFICDYHSYDRAIECGWTQSDQAIESFLSELSDGWHQWARFTEHIDTIPRAPVVIYKRLIPMIVKLTDLVEHSFPLRNLDKWHLCSLHLSLINTYEDWTHDITKNLKGYALTTDTKLQRDRMSIRRQLLDLLTSIQASVGLRKCPLPSTTVDTYKREIIDMMEGINVGGTPLVLSREPLIVRVHRIDYNLSDELAKNKDIKKAFQLYWRIHGLCHAILQSNSAYLDLLKENGSILPNLYSCENCKTLNYGADTPIVVMPVLARALWGHPRWCQ